MCAACGYTGRIDGRVDHMVMYTPENAFTSATYAYEAPAYSEGTGVPCPYCNPHIYGRIVRVTMFRDRGIQWPPA